MRHWDKIRTYDGQQRGTHLVRPHSETGGAETVDDDLNKHQVSFWTTLPSYLTL